MPKQLCLKRVLLLITLSLLSVISFSQLDETSPWVWMKGDNIYNAGGAYGTLGVGTSNNKPGNRIDAVNWTGNDGKMYFFGGSSIINSSTFFHNDFWQYDPTSNTWTWIGGSTGVDQFGTYGSIGVASPSNIPGSRSHAMSWKDSQGNFWLFGGHGYSSNSVGYLNDLWKYSPTTKLWTWVKGSNSSGGDPNAYGTLGVESPGNQPASRYEATTWTDASSNLWMFGGYNYPSHGLLNDLWKFNTATNNWVCYKVSQQNAAGQPQVRSGAKGWTDKAGNLWLFGGLGYNNIYMSDVWKYTLSTNQWTYIRGSSSASLIGSYGYKGVPSPSNAPGGRSLFTTWTDQNGLFWLFGGGGLTTSVNATGYLNDLWSYDPVSNIWTWIKGDNSLNQAGVYGSQTIANVNNKPGSRWRSVGWIDGTGNLWLFGGLGSDGPGSNGQFNDLWKLEKACPSLPLTTPSINSFDTIICSGSGVWLNTAKLPGLQYVWLKDGVVVPSSDTSCWASTPGIYSVKIYSVCSNDSAVSRGMQVTVLSSSVKPVITANGSLNFCNGGNVTLSSSTTTNNQWYKDNVAINGATNQSYVVSAAGTYKVVHSNACGSSTSDPVAITAATIPAITFTLVNSITDLDIQPLKDGDSINLATLSSTNLNIRANTASPIGSMVFNLTGAQSVNQTESVSPYSLFQDLSGDYLDWTPAVGNYTLKATPFCEAGGTGTAGTTATINFQVINLPPTNQLPTVNLYAYPLGSGIAPGTISVNVMAEDPDGTIAKIEIYQNGVLVFETQQSSGNFGFTGLSSGGYMYQAKAIDNQGGVTLSQLIPLFIYEPLSIGLIAPSSGSNFTAPATINLEATPSGGDGTFSKVEFYNGTTKLGEDLTAPYTFNWTNVAAGTYFLTVKVFHNMGDNAISSAVTITVDEPANQLPNISLTAPVNGASLPAPATVTLTAVASDADGSITKVEFYNGANKLGEDFTAPYQYEWSSVGAGNYSLTAKAIDNRGGISTSTAVSITILNPVNQPPTITLNPPIVTYGATNADPVTIFLQAMAYDTDGTIAKVECYQNGMLVGVATTPPYHFFAVIMNSGPYSFTAKAYDNFGAVTESNSVAVVVQRIPRVILNSPANGTTFTAPANINLSASVDQGDAPISKVEFYNGTTKLGEDLTTPYTFNWANVSAGTYKITAKVIDAWGISTFSPEVTFTVNEPINQLPTVTLTTPANGTSFTAPASISLTATASDVDGTISKVEFYNGATKLGEDITAPYQYDWSSVGGGNYSLTAKAIDNRGGISTSTAVSITILNPVNHPPTLSLSAPLVTYGPTNADPVTIFLQAMAYDTDGTIAKVECYQNGMLVGVATTPPYHFFAVIMNSGPYTFTARAYDNLGASSEMSVDVWVQRAPRVILNSPANGTTFTAPVTVNLSATVDQGDAPISKVEFYNGTTKIGEDLTTPYTFNWSNVAAGTYKVTARVSDEWGISTFSPEVTFTVNEPINQLPTITLSTPANGSSFTAPASIILTATASDVDGTISKVEFYNGATKLGEDSTAPFEFGWNGVSSGIYSLTAKAIDNRGGMSTSTAVSITVSELVNQLPTVNLTSPANGASFNAPASINLTATASDVDGTISKVEFYNGTTKLGEDLVAPYEYTWSGVNAGNYSLSAKAIDNMGGVSSSNTASVSVVAPPAGGTLVNKNSVWKYNDKGVDLGTSWTALNYNDASWSSGPGVLGYGTPVATTLNFGNKNNKYPSYYFRRSFEITDASIYTSLVFNIRRDDGAVVYLNGVEQFRTNMPGGTVSYNSFASSDLNGSDQSNYFSFRIAASQLRSGTNVIAVSVHQSDRKSADMSFDMEVLAETAGVNQLPIARISTVDSTGSKEGLDKTDKGRILVKAIPNPSTSYFTLLLQSNRSETVDIRVVDAMGRLVETRRKLPATASVKFGYNYRPGIYFAEVIQGTQRTTLKLIKGKD